MKEQFSEGIAMRVGKSLLFIAFFIIVLSFNAKAQVYYSAFSSSNSHYTTSAPTGVLCLAPGFTDASQIADADLTNYSSVTGLLSLGLLCSGNDYSIGANLALPNGMTEAPAGYYAGFRVRLNTVLNLSILQSNLQLRTYLNGQVQETTSGAGLLGLSLLSLSTNTADVSFQTTMPFDAVEIILNTDVISLGLLFNYQFFYAYASNALILPVKLTSFAAVAEGKQVRLNWATAAEPNVAKYEIERSNDGGIRFSTLNAIAAKSNTTGGSTYSYTDAADGEGNYIYRLKVIDKDGSAEYSKLVSVKLTATTKWKVYPTLLNSGSIININLAANGNNKQQVQLVNLQGQAVRSVTAVNGNLSIATNHVAAGMYVLKLYENGKLVASEKIAIQ